jgi:hypothetical protein
MRLSENEQLRDELVVRSLERSRAFSLERQAASMLETYAQLMNKTFTPAAAEQS